MNKTGYSRRVTTMCGVLALVWSCGPVAQADYIYGPATQVPNVSQPGDGGMQISRDGLELYFVRVSPNQCQDIWVAKRATTKEPWGAPVRLDPPVNSAGPVGGPCLSADGLELYFGDGHPEHYVPLGGTPNPQGYGGGDLWVSRRATKSDPWGPPQNLGPTVNTASYDDHPSLSVDGLSLYFASDRSGYNQYALWVTTRSAKDAPWGPPVPIGLPGNWPMFKTTPFISPDGLSLYYNYGGYTPDIYVSKRATTADLWERPVPFTPVNSAGAEWHLSFSEADSTLYFVRADNFYAVYGLWQVEVIPLVDFSGDGKVDERDYLMMTGRWGQNYPRCDIGPMGWGDGVVDARDAVVFLETMEGRDFPLSPGPHATEVSREAILTWTAPKFAQGQDVYFGTSFLEVSSAGRSNPAGVLVSQGQPATTYDPPGRLEFGRTYYWRVDFVGASPNPAIYKGPVLTFTTEAFAYPIPNVITTASGAQPGSGPERTIDSSGLDNNDGHSTDGKQMWWSTGVGANWIQYEFDKVYHLHELWVWNFNQVVEPFVGFGARSVRIEYSTDGTIWTPLAGVPEFARAPGQPGYAANTIVSFGGVAAKFVKLTIEKNWGVVTQTGLSEVRFFYLPDVAAQP